MKESIKPKSKAAPVLFRTTLRLHAPNAREVKVAGDFNDWQPQGMKRSQAGLWEMSLKLKPGSYQYKFVADGEWQLDPACSEMVGNEFGSLNNVLQIK